MTSPKKRLLILLPLFLLGIFLVGSQTAVAQTKTFNWEDWHSDITLLENGDLQVVETQTLNFQGEPFTFGFRTIQTGARGNNDGLTNISVREGDIVYEESRSNDPYTFEVSESGDETTIRWYFEPALGQHTYEFSYTVEGGTIVGTAAEGDGDQVFWTIIPDDHPARVDHASATITLPAGVEPQRYYDTDEYLVAGFINERENDAVTTSVSADGRVINYEYADPLLQGSSLSARVQYPHGILAVSTPGWQRSMQIADTLNTVFMGFALLLCMVGPLAVLLLWYLRGRDPQLTVVVPDYITEPPDDLPPAVVGTLIDEKADMQDIISTLIDLANRGYLTMEEEEKGRNHVFKRTEKTLRGKELRPFERQFMKDVFRSKKEVSLNSLRYKFSSKLPNLRTMLYQELVDNKLVPRSPQNTRRNYWALTSAVFVIGVIGFIAFSAIFSDTISSAVCLPLALFATAIALAVAATHMPTKTAKGVETAAKWEAFKKYLQNIEDYQDLAQTNEIFEKYLAYAVAFGLERTWIRKFSQVPSTPIPGWYMPYGSFYGGYHGGAGSRPVGSSGSGGSMSAPSLEGMSSSMAGGLAAMSSGLTRMLNSSSTVMKSVKPSSSGGGRSGGYSGGFSGGGGFSSGGGGSAGFG